MILHLPSGDKLLLILVTLCIPAVIVSVESAFTKGFYGIQGEDAI